MPRQQHTTQQVLIALRLQVQKSHQTLDCSASLQNTQVERTPASRFMWKYLPAILCPLSERHNIFVHRNNSETEFVAGFPAALGVESLVFAATSLAFIVLTAF